MAVSLYDISVASYLQTLTGVAGFLEKGRAHCIEAGIDPDSVVQRRLHPDMLPFEFQVLAVAHHSAGTVAAMQSGEFAPPKMIPDITYAGLQEQIEQARTTLKAVTPEAVEACAGGDIIFRLGKNAMPFRVPDFVLTFSLPNFHFHATTAYDILRHLGAPLGKRDYMGPLRLKGA